MAVQNLYKSKAFEPGSELWISPQADHSELTKDLNWYSNFLLSKMLKHKSPDLSENLIKRLQENHLEVLLKKVETKDTYLASTSKYFPNKMLLMKNYNENLQDWLKTCHESWIQLQKPSVRFFMPKDTTKDDFNKYWPDKSPANDISLVCH